jgi:hypothetical protein
MGNRDAATDRCAAAGTGRRGDEAGEYGTTGAALQSAAEDEASARQSAAPHRAVEEDEARVPPGLLNLRTRGPSRKTLYQPYVGRFQKAGAPDQPLPTLFPPSRRPAAPLRGKQVQWEERVSCLWFHVCSCDQREHAEVALIRAVDGPVRRLRPQRKREEQKERRGVQATILKSPIIVMDID